MTLLLPELKEKLSIFCDVCMLCEMLDIDEEELLERFEDKILENMEDMIDFCDEEEEEE